MRHIVGRTLPRAISLFRVQAWERAYRRAVN